MTSYKPKVFDFNFDGLEDFALEEDNTINTGLVHRFYMQKKRMACLLEVIFLSLLFHQKLIMIKSGNK